MPSLAAIVHNILGEKLTLLPEKAIFWEKAATILIADLHLGKITHFRKAGIGLPAEAEQDNLERLAQLLLDYPCKRVLLLGDLFHSDYNEEWPKFKQFLSQFPELSFVLVRGNHDILHAEDYLCKNLSVVDELGEGPFIFTHIPLPAPSAAHPTHNYNVCGHIHPGVMLRGKGMQSMKLPCFHFSKHCLVLPAFGTFTGTAKIKPHKTDDVFVITEHQVVKVN